MQYFTVVFALVLLACLAAFFQAEAIGDSLEEGDAFAFDSNAIDFDEEVLDDEVLSREKRSPRGVKRKKPVVKKKRTGAGGGGAVIGVRRTNGGAGVVVGGMGVGAGAYVANAAFLDDQWRARGSKKSSANGQRYHYGKHNYAKKYLFTVIVMVMVLIYNMH